MKILKIRLRNMHSLKGDHSIDFTSSPLSDAGLFVITGPTGAGKSTILDAITLALYNRIPRLKSKNITTKDIEEEGVIITKNAKDCFAEVEYEVKGKRYLSSWSISRNRNNKLNDRKQELVELETGNIICSGKNEVVLENEKIIGLSYEQFVQSLVLAQGQFAKLLLAKKDDRNKLLEDITGGAIYRIIGSEVYSKFAKSKKAVEDQKIRMGEIELLSEEEILTIQEEIESKKPIVKSLADQISKLDEKIKIKNDILNFTSELEKLTQEIKLFQEKKQLITNDEISLKEHDKLVVFKERLNTLESKRALISDLSKKIESLKSTIEVRSKEKETLIVKGISLTSKQLSDKDIIPALDSFYEQVTELIEKERKQSQLLETEKNRISDKIKDLSKYEISLDKDADLLPNLILHINSIQENTKKAGLKSVEEIRERKDTINKFIFPATKLLGDAKLFQEKESRLKEAEKRYAEKSNSLKDLLLKVKELKQAQELLNVTYLAKKEQLEEFKTQKGLEEYRKELEKDKPCPLCGSLEHPFVSSYDDSSFNIMQKEFEELSNKLDGLNNETRSAELLSTQYEKDLLESAEQNQQKKLELEALSSHIKMLCAELNWEPTIDIPAWDKNIASWQTEQSSLDELERKIHALSILEELQLIVSAVKTIEAHYLEVSNDRKKIYNGVDINKDVNDLKQNFNLLQAELQTKQKELAENELAFTNNSKEKLELEKALLQELKTLGINTTDELRSKLLEESKAAEIRNSIQALRDKEIELDTTKSSIEKKLEQAVLLDDLSINLQELKAVKEQTESEKEQIQKRIIELEVKLKNDDQNREKNKSAHQVLQLLQKDLDLWSKMNALIGDAKGNNFSNFVQDLTLEQLIHYGNKRLIGFSDRYLLDTPNPKESDALKVIDTFMGNTRRAVSSLSGGETFKLSLALAFGLSDLAAKNVEIESLFIDEGFGSLDPESLDQSISILEKMQNESNKSIGIISHVSELKDRIGTKIKLIQTGSGYSRIEVE